MTVVTLERRESNDTTAIIEGVLGFGCQIEEGMMMNYGMIIMGIKVELLLLVFIITYSSIIQIELLVINNSSCEEISNRFFKTEQQPYTRAVYLTNPTMIGKIVTPRIHSFFSSSLSLLRCTTRSSSCTAVVAVVSQHHQSYYYVGTCTLYYHVCTINILNTNRQRLLTPLSSFRC